MSVFLRDYLTVVWFGLAALAIGGILLGLAALVRPSSPNYDKGIAYESGVDPVGMGWSQSQIRYYVFALLFLVRATRAAVTVQATTDKTRSAFERDPDACPLGCRVVRHRRSLRGPVTLRWRQRTCCRGHRQGHASWTRN